MKKFIALALTLMVTVSLFAGCSSGSSEPAAAPKTDTPTETSTPAAPEGGSRGVIYGIYKSGDQTWFLDEGDAARAAAEAAGYEFNYVDVQLSAESYLKAIDNAIANNAAGVVTCPPRPDPV